MSGNIDGAIADLIYKEQTQTKIAAGQQKKVTFLCRLNYFFTVFKNCLISANCPTFPS
ncbi:hypothetical protein KL86DES1_20298 [uncultured Desulfovibrio sp.]|uniref:Uncharacterized protein n=1 Tax=uncultured Desulfovibrio sp. TaxID=167968 RepID=A0A212L326_9BACT|nr:hypothetical protein KL86DES1_20298 [uncultured Desulfovibrio sp.]VZH33200.1 conserved protein of unknown function [Desulfovibrio sp. 86]